MMVHKSIFEVFKSQLLTEKVYEYDSTDYYGQVGYVFTTDSGVEYISYFTDDGIHYIGDKDIRYLFESSKLNHMKEKYSQLMSDIDYIENNCPDTRLLGLNTYELSTERLSNIKNPKEAKSVLIDTNISILKHHLIKYDIPLIKMSPATNKHGTLYNIAIRRSLRKENNPNYNFTFSPIKGFLLINFSSKQLLRVINIRSECR